MNHRAYESSDKGQVSLRERVGRIPLLSPRACSERLEEMGYRGQTRGRQAASVLAYRHVRRLRRLFIDGESPDGVGPRDNYLFVGPTGSGKTFLVELLFKEILAVPTVIVDITQYSETGYIGEDVSMMLARLFEAAGQDLAWSSCGVVCMDEFDKLASSRSNARFAGEGTTKDVSGFGVQRGLLTLLSADDAQFPADFGYAQLAPKLTLSLRGLSFIACGAFSGFQATASSLDDTERIGYQRNAQPRFSEAIAARFEEGVLERTAAFARYGFLPELIGRFSRVVIFDPLDRDTLRSIVDHNVLDAYRREFASEGIELTVDASVLDHIVGRALKRELGARGLRTSLLPHLERAAFEHFGETRSRSVRLIMKDESIVVESHPA